MPAKRPVIRRVSAREAARRSVESSSGPAGPENSATLGGEDLLDLPLTGAASSTPSSSPEAIEAGPGSGPSPPEAPGRSSPAAAEEVFGERPGQPLSKSAPAAVPSPGIRARHPRRGAKKSGSRLLLWIAFLLLLPLAAAAGFLLRPLPPVAVMSTDLLDFGEVRLGEETALTLDLRNDGESALELLKVEILDDPDGVVRRAPGGCESPVLEGQSCQLRLIMAPASTDPLRGRLQLWTNASEEASSLPLIGRGITPLLAVEPENLDLGQATVGERGKRGRVRLANRGSASMRVDSVTLEGLGAADFVRYQDRCRGVTLDPSSSCTVGFEFVPTKDGSRRASVRVKAGGISVKATALEGRGLPQLPVLALSPDRLDFGSLRLGAAAETRAVELRNDGNGPLDIRSVSLASASGSTDGFSVSDEGCVDRRLEPGASCRLQASFSPEAVGRSGAVIEVRHSAAPGIHRVPVVGVGTAPRAELLPAKLGFGEVPIGSDSGWRDLVVRNTGSAELRVMNVTVQGADGRSFQVSSEGCLRAPIPPGQSCSAEVRFRARREGPHRAEVLVEHDSTSSPDRVAANGLGTSARLGIDPVSVDFGTVRVGEQRQRQLTIRNSGRAPLTLKRATLRGGQGLRIDRDCRGVVVSPGGSCVLSMTLSADREGSLRARLRLDHDGPDSPRELDVTATLAPEPKPAIELNPPRLDLGERPVGDRGPIFTLEVRNPGAAPLELRELEVEGPTASSFQIVPGSCADTVPARGSCTIGVSLTPAAAGPQRATVTIRHNAAGGVTRVPVLGLGLGVP